jgi:hypothetical protein
MRGYSNIIGKIDRMVWQVMISLHHFYNILITQSKIVDKIMCKMQIERR